MSKFFCKIFLTFSFHLLIFSDQFSTNSTTLGPYKLPYKRHKLNQKNNTTRKIKNLIQKKNYLKNENKYFLTKRRTKEYGTPLIDSYNTVYTAIVTIGTPEQQFNVVVDTGNKFDSSASSTFLSTNINFECSYADGTNCKGILGVDRFKRIKTKFDKKTFLGGKIESNPFILCFVFKFGSDLNSLIVPTALIGLAKDAESVDSMVELKIDGIFGLAPPKRDDLCGFESPLFTAYKNGLIKKSIFSVYMHNSKDSERGEYGGEITFGAIDKENCDESSVYWTKAHLSDYWTFKLDGISHAGKSIKINSNVVISDTGSSLISGPKNAVKTIYASLGDIKEVREGILIPCDKEYEPIIFKVGKMEFKLGKEVLTIQNDQLDGEMCEFGIVWSDGFDFWVFGDPFIRKYCTIYDFGHRKIGFAAQKQ
ncbi:Peptidase A1 domain-containing protein [Meloidogyne graminicola]|uniref:Peptidase A1 domain-containing protein n=1 Tax=Meloidogyne graminicola TaxID=189291 RepID=A0A8S9ZFF3_9BILA|nr:Peptidase A1 domain-containing protein [Meloidogyne graminicola]